MVTETISWQRDVDAALAQAEQEKRPLLLDFTAAPA
jgi:thiol:disulfide interchange protein